MIEIWYGILSFMLVMFLVLEGFDFGAGMLQQVVGKTEAERRLVIAVIGPLWSWHEVWLVGFGGTLLVAFPSIMTASFAGFYLAFFLLLWSIVLRGVSIEVSGHIEDSMWRTAWNFVFVASNILLAVLVGAALGNVLRGVPLGPDGKFALSFFTNFAPFSNVGILDWYTVSVAVFIVVTLAAHGANGLILKTEGPVYERSRRVAGLLWKIVPVLLAIITVESYYLRPALFSGIMHQPFGWLGLVGVFGGLIAVFTGLQPKREKFAFIGSCAFIAGLMIAGAAGAFPIMLYSTLAPENSLSAYQMSASGYGLAVALVWWPIAAIFAAFYFMFIYKHYSSKVKPSEDTQRPY
ncbi:MAG TPA: cytochrome d ubiquinol oxidase subunit II [Candidatus Acidoferrales bacterium]|jgi:cytochrome d ubiquinol oxidase subunit II|nr:cytochrome d ubiquinol oxidase subunit II [Candidatus Acidoferrales bacterium]